jgi:prophage regulatory protein
MTTEQHQTPVLVRVDDVVARYGLHGHEQLYNLMAAGQFPRPIRLGKRAVAWVEAELQDWLASRVAERNARHINTSPVEAQP